MDESTSCITNAVVCKIVNVILKSDGPGTQSALEKIMDTLAPRSKEIQVVVVGSTVGDVTQSDVEQLSAVKGAETCVLAFNVGVADSSTRSVAKELDIKIIRSNVDENY